MASNWLDTLSKNKDANAWYAALQAAYPELQGTSIRDYVAKDTSGYDYSKAVAANRYPKIDSGTGQLHWDDIGKGDTYWKNYLVQNMFPAVRRQEGPAVYDPVKHIDTRDQTIKNSIRNNWDRWNTKYPDAMNNPKAPDYVTFMGNEGGPVGKGWANPKVSPINKTWIPGVKSIMKQNLGTPTYNYLHDMNIVQPPVDNWGGAIRGNLIGSPWDTGVQYG